MDYEADRIFEISLAKFDRSKTLRKQSSTSSNLHRNLLVSSVLKAITTDSASGKGSLMDYRESKIIDMDLDDSNYEIVNQDRCPPVKANRTCSGSKVQNGYEWKPRVRHDCNYETESVNESDDKASSETQFSQTAEINRELSTVEDMLDSFKTDSDKENIQFEKQEIRNAVTCKRPRDSSSDMNHMPRPNKIFKGYSHDACNHIINNDSHAMSNLENLFRDSFNDLMEQNNMDRPVASMHSYLSFPLVSVMAC